MSAVNERDRFLAVFDYRESDRAPLRLAGPWEDTLARWRTEGLGVGEDPHARFAGEELKVYNYGYRFGMFPAFETRVLREDGDSVISIDASGRTVRNFRDRTSMPEWLDFPVKSPADLRRIIDERFDPALLRERFTPEVESAARAAASSGDTVTMVNGGGYYWLLREMAGVDGASYIYYDAPELVNELYDRIEELIDFGLRRFLEIGVPDVIGYGEDVAFKTGPLISPDMFREFILPRYRRTLDIAHAGGVRHTWFDSDGDLRLLLPDMLAIGIDGIAPCEVAANMCPERLRRQFGRGLRILGGIDKREIAKGRAAIDAELAKLKPLVVEGGFVPFIDHSVPADVGWADYQYFMEQLPEFLKRD